MKGAWHPQVSTFVPAALPCRLPVKYRNACSVIGKFSEIRLADGDLTPCMGVQEDQRLCEILQQLGGCKSPGFSWSDVARALGGGRVGKSCRLRWCELGPSQKSWVCAGLHAFALRRAVPAPGATSSLRT